MPNPYCTQDTIPEIAIWSINGDFFDCQDEVCAKFKEQYGNEPVTVVIPSSSKAAPYYANLLSTLSPSLMIIENEWDILVEEECLPDRKTRDAINGRHILIIGETLVAQKDFEGLIQPIALYYQPKSITVLCRHGQQQESERTYFAEHAIINRNDGNNSPLPAEKYQVRIQNDYAIYHPAQLHIKSKEEKYHVVLYLQNGQLWLVKNYGCRKKTDDFADIKEKVNLWLSLPSQLAIAGGMTNRELALGLWEINNPSAKLCRIGYMGDHSEFEVYVNKDDFSYVPHFHIRRLGFKGETYFETRVKLLTNEYYFPQKGKKMRLTREQCMMLVKFMEKNSCHLHYKTNYNYATLAWTMNNHCSARKCGKPVPDYSTIYDVVKVRIDMSQLEI